MSRGFPSSLTFFRRDMQNRCLTLLPEPFPILPDYRLIKTSILREQPEHFHEKRTLTGNQDIKIPIPAEFFLLSNRNIKLYSNDCSVLSIISSCSGLSRLRKKSLYPATRTIRSLYSSGFFCASISVCLSMTLNWI